jgi:hypothetical protein
MKKKNTLSILTASILLLSLVLIIQPTSLAVGYSISGYVYVNDEITVPDEVIIDTGTQKIAELWPDGYYVVEIDEPVGTTADFFVTISDQTWQADETFTVPPTTTETSNLYTLDLHINTSDEPIGDDDDDDNGGGGSGGGGGGGGGAPPEGPDEPTDGEDTGGEVIPNNPPVMETFTGNETGTQNMNYTYSANATDPDGNEVSYTFDWDDGSNDTTEYVASNNTYDIMHMWTAAGVYEISVYAMDNYPEEGNGSISNTLELTVLIDAHIIDDPTNGVDGYLTDDDSDGIYDYFHNDEDDIETAVEYDDVNGTYMIDTDGDGEYDYIYNPDTGTGEPIVTEEPEEPPAGDDKTEEDNTIYYVAAIVIIIVLLLLFFLATRKKGKKK